MTRLWQDRLWAWWAVAGLGLLLWSAVLGGGLLLILAAVCCGSSILEATRTLRKPPSGS